MGCHLDKVIIFICLFSSLAAENCDIRDISNPNSSYGLQIQLSHETPSAEEFVKLRSACGMRKRNITSAEKGLKNSLFWVTLRCQGELIGMGRVIGDGGTVVQITDIAVHPNYQKIVYGKLIFETIQDYILKEIPDDAFVCLFAEREAAPFYQNYGFLFSQEQWPGMYWPCAERKIVKGNLN